MSRLPVIDDAGFAPFGTIHPARPGSRDEAAEQWVKFASDRYGSPVESARFTLKPSSSASLLEVHARSPQLTVVFDSEWVVRVIGTGGGPRGDFAKAEFQSFVVPPNVGVILDAGLWHAPVLVRAESEVLVAFREGTRAHATDWISLPEPMTFSD